MPYQLQSPGQRIIIIDNGIIYKHDVDFDDPQAEAELERWDKIEECDKKYFVPIIAYRIAKKECWTAQPFLKFDESLRTWELWELISGIACKYCIKDIDYEWNWAVTEDGLPVIYDYAF